MKKLLSYLEKFSLKNALAIEKTDRQFQALKKLYESMVDRDLFLVLIIANSTVGYLLSSSGEDYWEEFSEYFGKKKDLKRDTIIKELIDFLPLSKGNKRLRNHKISRLKKLETFLLSYNLVESKDFNFIDFQEKLSRHMRQKRDTKTITYTIKMLSYGVRIISGKDIIVPFETSIPVDSRLIRIFELYQEDFSGDIKVFYEELSKITRIPPIHLDGILWTNYKEILTLKDK